MINGTITQENRPLVFKFEVDAYDVEIKLAKQHGLSEMVERLEELKQNRRRELLGE